MIFRDYAKIAFSAALMLILFTAAVTGTTYGITLIVLAAVCVFALLLIPD